MLPTTTLEQREPMYEDLVPLITPGFLSAKMQVGGLSLGLRSLSPNDMNLLRYAAREGGPEWPYYMAAASIWMIDGVLLLENYPYTFKIAFEFLHKSSNSVVRAIFAQTLSFFQRMRTANRVLESFLYEEESRRLWRATNNGAMPINAYAGIPGVERIGLNSYQSVWVQWNRTEDDRQDDNYSWSLTKVLVSVHSSKSAKKLDAKDKSRLESEKTRRQEVQDRTYYIWKGVLDEAAHPLLTIHQPRSPRELAEEMRRWVAGEKDFHDLVVDDYKERVKQEFIRREQEREVRAQAARERAAQEERLLGTQKPAIVAYTPDELAKLRPPPAKPGAKFIIENDLVARTFNRYLRDNPDPGKLSVEGGRLVYRDPSTTPEEHPSERPSLNDLIANRKPTING